jgi:flagellar protein FliJ
MPFRFTLQPVLRLRTSYETLERLRLLAVIARVIRTRQEIAEFEKESAGLREIFQRNLRRGVTAVEIHFEQACQRRRAEHSEQLQARLAELERLQAKQRQIYQAALQKRDILENLRQRQWREYRIHQSRREQQRLDELFVIRRGPSPSDTPTE